ncbi:hypothetical protein ACSQ67_004814 [Phaseolus vulgaris]
MGMFTKVGGGATCRRGGEVHVAERQRVRGGVEEWCDFGEGVLVWANGNRYEGFWENGVPVGKGVFTWYDGSTCAGNWGKEFMEEAREEKMKRSSVDGCRSVSFPRICIWELDGEAGDITCDIVHNAEASLFYRDGTTTSESENGDDIIINNNNGCGVLQKSPCWSLDGSGSEVKKPGQTVSRGHKSYDLILNLQLGIRYTVVKHSSIVRELRPGDFDPKEKFWTRFPPEGSRFTPQHQSVDFRWKDYCPMVFRHLRELFAIDPADYMLAICGSDSLREMSSPGKSGSIFYLTQDDRFIIKTVKKSEVKVLIRMLPSYYQHVCQYKNSLVTAFLGVHCVKPVGGQKTRFIVMGNVFCSEYRIHKRFDLKGSSHGRTTDKPRGRLMRLPLSKTLILILSFAWNSLGFKSLYGIDFAKSHILLFFWIFILCFLTFMYCLLLRQLDRDCEFLEAEGIMDYSLLIGLHFRDDCSVDEMKSSPRNSCSGKRDMLDDEMLTCRGPLIRLGMNMPARAESVCKAGLDQPTGSGSGNSSSIPSESNSQISDVILYFGIIDILQDYDISKKIEHAYKSLQVDSTSISAVDPKLYSKRFRDFIHRIFVEDK